MRRAARLGSLLVQPRHGGIVAELKRWQANGPSTSSVGGYSTAVGAPSRAPRETACEFPTLRARVLYDAFKAAESARIAVEVHSESSLVVHLLQRLFSARGDWSRAVVCLMSHKSWSAEQRLECCEDFLPRWPPQIQHAMHQSVLVEKNSDLHLMQHCASLTPAALAEPQNSKNPPLMESTAGATSTASASTVRTATERVVVAGGDGAATPLALGDRQMQTNVIHGLLRRLQDQHARGLPKHQELKVLMNTIASWTSNPVMRNTILEQQVLLRTYQFDCWREATALISGTDMYTSMLLTSGNVEKVLQHVSWDHCAHVILPLILRSCQDAVSENQLPTTQSPISESSAEGEARGTINPAPSAPSVVARTVFPSMLLSMLVCVAAHLHKKISPGAESFRSPRMGTHVLNAEVRNVLRALHMLAKVLSFAKEERKAEEIVSSLCNAVATVDIARNEKAQDPMAASLVPSLELILHTIRTLHLRPESSLLRAAARVIPMTNPLPPALWGSALLPESGYHLLPPLVPEVDSFCQYILGHIHGGEGRWPDPSRGIILLFQSWRNDLQGPIGDVAVYCLLRSFCGEGGGKEYDYSRWVDALRIYSTVPVTEGFAGKETLMLLMHFAAQQSWLKAVHVFQMMESRKETEPFAYTTRTVLYYISKGTNWSTTLTAFAALRSRYMLNKAAFEIVMKALRHEVRYPNPSTEFPISSAWLLAAQLYCHSFLANQNDNLIVPCFDVFIESGQWQRCFQLVSMLQTGGGAGKPRPSAQSHFALQILATYMTQTSQHRDTRAMAAAIVLAIMKEAARPAPAAKARTTKDLMFSSLADLGRLKIASMLRGGHSLLAQGCEVVLQQQGDLTLTPALRAELQQAMVEIDLKQTGSHSFSRGPNERPQPVSSPGVQTARQPIPSRSASFDSARAERLLDELLN